MAVLHLYLITTGLIIIHLLDMEPSKKTFEKMIDPTPSELNNLFLKRYPNLSQAELKLCQLLVLNISSKEMGELTGRSIRTIESTRYNIRKKMNLPHDESLVKHLILFAEEGKVKN